MTILRTLLLFATLLFVGCSFKTEPNLWEYKSAQAFESYKQNFLKGNDLLAKHDLAQAIKHAKSSADLSQLASIYLGKCALNKSVGIQDTCNEFQDIQELIACPKLQNYNRFLQKDFTHLKIKYLPSRYQEFAAALKNDNTQQANAKLQQMEDPVSMMLALALLGENATKESVEMTLQKASYYGYKKGVLHLLKELIQRETDPKKKAVLQKKIEILKM